MKQEQIPLVFEKLIQSGKLSPSISKKIEVISLSNIQGVVYEEKIIEQSVSTTTNKIVLSKDRPAVSKLLEIPSSAKFNKEEFLDKEGEEIVYAIEPNTLEERDCDFCDGHGDVECENCFGKGEVDCKICLGKGIVEKIEEKEELLGKSPCAVCKTEGFIKCPSCFGQGHKELPCVACQGLGVLKIKERCVKCQGSGKIRDVNFQPPSPRMPGASFPPQRPRLNFNPNDPNNYAERMKYEEELKRQREEEFRQREIERTQQYLQVNNTGFHPCETCEGQGATIKEIPCSQCQGQGKKEVPCPHCAQKGTIRCKSCEGKGYIENKQKKKITISEDCKNCHGVGSFVCHECNGTGRKTCKDCKGERRIHYMTLNKFTLNISNKYHILLPSQFQVIDDLKNIKDFEDTKDLTDEIYDSLLNLQNSLGKVYPKKTKIFRGGYLKYKVGEEKFNLFVTKSGIYYDYLPGSLLEGKGLYTWTKGVKEFFGDLTRRIKKRFEKDTY